MCLKCGCRLKYKNGVPVVSRWLKNLLFVANFITWVVGTFMLFIGFYAKIDKSYTSSVSGLVIDPVTPILVTGGLIFFVTFFGCVGALRENLCMLTFFSYALVLALVVEVGSAFLAVALDDNVRDKLGELMTESIIHYRDDPDLQNIIDWGQEAFECCGVYSVHDWGENVYFNCSENNPSIERCGVPYSCCKLPSDGVVNTLCGMDIQSMNEYDITVVVYTDGCVDAFVSWLHDNLFYIAIFTFVFCCIPQVLGVTISRILILQIKDQDFYVKIGLLNDRGEFEMNWFS